MLKKCPNCGSNEIYFDKKIKFTLFMDSFQAGMYFEDRWIFGECNAGMGKGCEQRFKVNLHTKEIIPIKYKE